MIPIASLWIPILLSAVIVFVASSVIHMALTYHRTDFGRIPDEDKVMDGLRKFSTPTGDYLIPCAGSPKEMKAPEFIDKMTRGPVASLTVMKSGPPSMGMSFEIR